MSAGSSPAPRPLRTRWHRLAGLVTASAVLVGCTSGGDEPGGVAPAVTDPRRVGPSAAHLDLSGLPVPRTDVCHVLADNDVEQALGGAVADTAHYGNGDDFEVTPGRVDISHEHGCVYVGGDGTAARVWIFARPVLRSEADTLVRQARRARDCAFPESVVFGAPGLTSVCEVADADTGGGTSAEGGPAFRGRLEGLFGDTWMGCEVSEPLTAMAGSGTGSPVTRADVVQRAEQWCTEVVTTISAS